MRWAFRITLRVHPESGAPALPFSFVSCVLILGSLPVHPRGPSSIRSSSSAAGSFLFWLRHQGSRSGPGEFRPRPANMVLMMNHVNFFFDPFVFYRRLPGPGPGASRNRNISIGRSTVRSSRRIGQIPIDRHNRPQGPGEPQSGGGADARAKRHLVPRSCLKGTRNPWTGG